MRNENRVLRDNLLFKNSTPEQDIHLREAIDQNVWLKLCAPFIPIIIFGLVFKMAGLE